MMLKNNIRLPQNQVDPENILAFFDYSGYLVNKNIFTITIL